MAHTFTSTGTPWSPSTGNSLPVRTRRLKVQASDESAGGILYVQDKGIEVFVHEFVFSNLSSVDMSALVAFTRTQIVYSLHTFTWTDLDSATHTVRLVGSNLDSEKVVSGRHAVILRLREEGPA